MKRTISTVVTVVAALLLGACDDGASCDMDPDQDDCPEDDGYGGGGGGYFPTPTPPANPSQGVRVLGANGSSYAGETVFVSVGLTDSFGQVPLTLCAAALVGSAGDFAVAFDEHVLSPGWKYAIDVLADLDESGGLTAGEPRWYGTFTTPTATTVTSSTVAFDLATAPLGSWHGWSDAACVR